MLEDVYAWRGRVLAHPLVQRYPVFTIPPPHVQLWAASNGNITTKRLEWNRNDGVLISYRIAAASILNIPYTNLDMLIWDMTQNILEIPHNLSIRLRQNWNLMDGIWPSKASLDVQWKPLTKLITMASKADVMLHVSILHWIGISLLYDLHE